MGYRYIMCHGFSSPVYKDKLLSIEIPVPFLRDTKEEAMKDGSIGVRFNCINDNGKENIYISFYPGEDFKVSNKANGEKQLSVWTVGVPFYHMDYEEFRKLGGGIFINHLNENGFYYYDPENEEQICKDSFNDLFPDRHVGMKPIYIDSEAYSIREE